jgi:hypothetical protein
MPIGIGFGATVFCCDNMSFIAEHVVKRKHTANAKRDLPGIIMEMVEPLANARGRQGRIFDVYRKTPISIEQADHAVIEMYRRGLFGIQTVADVLREFEQPSFEEMQAQTAWSLFNATTFTLEGKIVGNPRSATTIHQVIDGVCEHIN